MSSSTAMITGDMEVGLRVTRRQAPFILGVDVINAELCAQNPVRDQSFLEGLGGTMAALLE